MKGLKTFSLLFAALALAAGLTVANPALADCGKPKKERMGKMSNMKGMEMEDEMPMCAVAGFKLVHFGGENWAR